MAVPAAWPHESLQDLNQYGLTSTTSPHKLPDLHQSSNPQMSKSGSVGKGHKSHNPQMMHRITSDEHDKIMNMLNPHPLPYQVQMFKSSTLTKVVDVPRRHHETFGYPYDTPLQKQKGVIIHSDRYAWDRIHRAEKINQKQRLNAEQEQVERARGLKRRREVIAHRTKHELLLGGEKLALPRAGISAAEASSGHPLPPAQTLQPEESQLLDDRLTHSAPDFAEDFMLGPSQLAWEQEKATFETNVGTASMGVQKMALHGRDVEPPPAPSQPSRPSPPAHTSNLQRIPFPYIPSMASSISGSEYDFMLSRPRDAQTDKPLRRRITQFILDGNMAPMCERADIVGELRYLKSMILPSFARDLYVGRGIKLPKSHTIVNPRTMLQPKPLPPIGSGPAVSAETSTVRFLTETGAEVHVAEGAVEFVHGRPDLKQTLYPSNTEQPENEEDEQMKEMEDHNVERQQSQNSIRITSANEEEKQDSMPVEDQQKEEQEKEAVDESLELDVPLWAPFKGLSNSEVILMVEPDAYESYVHAFDSLEVEGNSLSGVKFERVKGICPSFDLSTLEERFVQEIYNMSIEAAPFGVTQFVFLNLLIQKIPLLGREKREAFDCLSSVDLRSSITKYVERFHAMSEEGKKEVSLDLLKTMLSRILERDLATEAKLWEKIMANLAMDATMLIKSLDYISYIPYFISLASYGK